LDFFWNWTFRNISDHGLVWTMIALGLSF